MNNYNSYAPSRANCDRRTIYHPQCPRDRSILSRSPVSCGNRFIRCAYSTREKNETARVPQQVGVLQTPDPLSPGERYAYLDDSAIEHLVRQDLRPRLLPGHTWSVEPHSPPGTQLHAITDIMATALRASNALHGHLDTQGSLNGQATSSNGVEIYRPLLQAPRTTPTGAITLPGGVYVLRPLAWDGPTPATDTAPKGALTAAFGPSAQRMRSMPHVGCLKTPQFSPSKIASEGNSTMVPMDEYDPQHFTGVGQACPGGVSARPVFSCETDTSGTSPNILSPFHGDDTCWCPTPSTGIHDIIATFPMPVIISQIFITVPDPMPRNPKDYTCNGDTRVVPQEADFAFYFSALAAFTDVTDAPCAPYSPSPLESKTNGHVNPTGLKISTQDIFEWGYRTVVRAFSWPAGLQVRQLGIRVKPLPMGGMTKKYPLDVKIQSIAFITGPNINELRNYSHLMVPVSIPHSTPAGTGSGHSLTVPVKDQAKLIVTFGEHKWDAYRVWVPGRLPPLTSREPTAVTLSKITCRPGRVHDSTKSPEENYKLPTVGFQVFVTILGVGCAKQGSDKQILTVYPNGNTVRTTNKFTKRGGRYSLSATEPLIIFDSSWDPLVVQYVEILVVSLTVGGPASTEEQPQLTNIEMFGPAFADSTGVPAVRVVYSQPLNSSPLSFPMTYPAGDGADYYESGASQWLILPVVDKQVVIMNVYTGLFLVDNKIGGSDKTTGSIGGAISKKGGYSWQNCKGSGWAAFPGWFPIYPGSAGCFFRKFSVEMIAKGDCALYAWLGVTEGIALWTVHGRSENALRSEWHPYRKGACPQRASIAANSMYFVNVGTNRMLSVNQNGSVENMVATTKPIPAQESDMDCFSLEWVKELGQPSGTLSPYGYPISVGTAFLTGTKMALGIKPAPVSEPTWAADHYYTIGNNELGTTWAFSRTKHKDFLVGNIMRQLGQQFFSIFSSLDEKIPDAVAKDLQKRLDWSSKHYEVYFTNISKRHYQLPMYPQKQDVAGSAAVLGPTPSLNLQQGSSPHALLPERVPPGTFWETNGSGERFCTLMWTRHIYVENISIEIPREGLLPAMVATDIQCRMYSVSSGKQHLEHTSKWTSPVTPDPGDEKIVPLYINTDPQGTRCIAIQVVVRPNVASDKGGTIRVGTISVMHAAPSFPSPSFPSTDPFDLEDVSVPFYSSISSPTDNPARGTPQSITTKDLPSRALQGGGLSKATSCEPLDSVPQSVFEQATPVVDPVAAQTTVPVAEVIAAVNVADAAHNGLDTEGGNTAVDAPAGTEDTILDAQTWETAVTEQQDNMESSLSSIFPLLYLAFTQHNNAQNVWQAGPGNGDGGGDDEGGGAGGGTVPVRGVDAAFTQLLFLLFLAHAQVEVYRRTLTIFERIQDVIADQGTVALVLNPWDQGGAGQIPAPPALNPPIEEGGAMAALAPPSANLAPHAEVIRVTTGNLQANIDMWTRAAAYFGAVVSRAQSVAFDNDRLTPSAQDVEEGGTSVDLLVQFNRPLDWAGQRLVASIGDVDLRTVLQQQQIAPDTQLEQGNPIGLIFNFRVNGVNGMRYETPFEAIRRSLLDLFQFNLWYQTNAALVQILDAQTPSVRALQTRIVAMSSGIYGVPIRAPTGDINQVLPPFMNAVFYSAYLHVQEHMNAATFMPFPNPTTGALPRRYPPEYRDRGNHERYSKAVYASLLYEGHEQIATLMMKGKMLDKLLPLTPNRRGQSINPPPTTFNANFANPLLSWMNIAFLATRGTYAGRLVAPGPEQRRFQVRTRGQWDSRRWPNHRKIPSAAYDSQFRRGFYGCGGTTGAPGPVGAPTPNDPNQPVASSSGGTYDATYNPPGHPPFPAQTPAPPPAAQPQPNRNPGPTLPVIPLDAD